MTCTGLFFLKIKTNSLFILDVRYLQANLLDSRPSGPSVISTIRGLWGSSQCGIRNSLLQNCLLLIEQRFVISLLIPQPLAHIKYRLLLLVGIHLLLMDAEEALPPNVPQHNHHVDAPHRQLPVPQQLPLHQHTHVPRALLQFPALHGHRHLVAYHLHEYPVQDQRKHPQHPVEKYKQHLRPPFMPLLAHAPQRREHVLTDILEALLFVHGVPLRRGVPLVHCILLLL